MKTMTRRTALTAAGLMPLAAPAIVRAANAPIEIPFFFPIAVAGPISKLVDSYAAAFGEEHKDIVIKPVFAGSYDDTIAKAITAFKAGSAPPLAMLGAIQVFGLIDLEAIVPFDELATSVEDKAWMNGFFPAFLANGNVQGHTWSIPFQRSTVVLFWNKTAFHEAGLDPEKPPTNWTEHAAFAEKLTKKSGDTVARWGTQIPSSGGSYFPFQALATEAGQRLMSPEGDTVFFNAPGTVEALEYWVDLGKRGIHPPGVVDWGVTPNDFVAGRTAMMWTTTGTLTFVKDKATFPFGVAMCPAGKQRGTPTGGANFHIFKTASKAERDAAMLFVKWATAPARAAQWSIATGYVATQPAAWDTPEMKAYAAGFPQAAVARDQLQYAVPELSTHENQQVTLPFNSALQAALAGSKTAKTALNEAQANADRLLKPYRHG